MLPSTFHLAVPMITKADELVELAKEANIVVQEMPLTRHDVYTCDECFLTGTAAEIIPVTKCDGRPLGTGKVGPMTLQLREAFQRLTRM